MFLELRNVSFTYMKGTPLAQEALKDINFSVEKDEFIGLIGPTGSGKSTLAQHIAGLLLPSEGEILIEGKKLKEEISPTALRKKAGLVFQNPENQLFAETVFDDVAFGPRNIGCAESEVEIRVKEALELMGLDLYSFKDRSPFELSGGEMRRVAISGVLAMEPEILILDEPTSGLDARGREEITSYIRNLQKKNSLTVILVSHNMDEIAHFAGRIVVLDEGKIVYDDVPGKIFTHRKKLEEIGLDVPEITKLLISLRDKGIKVPTDILDLDEAKQAIIKSLRR